MALLKYLDNRFTFLPESSTNKTNNLNGIWKTRYTATNILAKLNPTAFLILPFDNSHNALVVPQTGQSIWNSFSNRQKWGCKFNKPIRLFLNKTNTRIISRLLSKILILFCRKQSVEMNLRIHLGIMDISILFIHSGLDVRDNSGNQILQTNTIPVRLQEKDAGNITIARNDRTFDR